MDKKELLKQISENAAKPARRPPRSEQPRHAQPEDPMANPPPAPQPPASTFTGKTAAIWLDVDDRTILNEATVLALNQGLKPSDSLIVRAALRLMPRGPQLLDQIRELMERDGRKLRHQKPEGSKLKG